MADVLMGFYGIFISFNIKCLLAWCEKPVTKCLIWAILGTNHPQNFFKIFKNALRQFIPHCPVKRVNTSTNWFNRKQLKILKTFLEYVELYILLKIKELEIKVA